MDNSTEVDIDLVRSLAEQYYGLFRKTLQENDMIVKGDFFTNRDMAYVMMHMSTAFTIFDEKMEEIFENSTKGKVTEGETLQ